MARARGALSQLAAAFETTYGTAPAGGFLTMPFVSTTLGAEQPLLEDDLLGQGRDPLAPSRDAVTAGGEVVVPIDAEAFGFWLKGAFGAPVTTGLGPYTHSFQSGAASLPSIAIEKQLPEVPYHAMYEGCVVGGIGWTMQRAGLLTAKVDLVAQGETVSALSNAGVLAGWSPKRFGHFQGSISRDGLPLASIVSAEIGYSNALDPVETIRADGLIDGADPSVAALKGNLVARFADTALIDLAVAGDPCELAFGYAHPAGPSLSFTAHAVYLPRPRVAIDGPKGVQVSFDWVAAKAASPARMCTVVLINDVAGY